MNKYLEVLMDEVEFFSKMVFVISVTLGTYLLRSLTKAHDMAYTRALVFILAYVFVRVADRSLFMLLYFFIIHFSIVLMLPTKDIDITQEL